MDNSYTATPNNTLPIGQYFLGCSLISLEFALHTFLLLPLIAINYYVLLPTALVHPNLKFILLCQNGDILLYMLSRILYISLKFCFGPFWNGMPFLKAPMFFSFLFGNWIGHVLLLERLMATFFVKTYEKSKRPWFSLVWFPILILITMENTYSQILKSADIHEISSWTLVQFAFLLFCSFAEFIICSILAIYNENIFKQELFLPAHNLSERYQLAENVKTAKQLRPALFFHFVNILLSSGATFMLYSKTIKGAIMVEMVLMAFYLGLTLSNCVIVLTVVGLHPAFRLKVKALLRRIICRCQNSIVSESQSHRITLEEASMVASRNRVANRTEEYFKTLNEYWRIGRAQ